MSEKSFDEHVAGMTAPSAERLAAVRPAIRGLGGGVLAGFNEFEDALSRMPQLGRDGADKKAQLRGDTALPHDHRTRAADETHDYHKVLIHKHAEFGGAAKSRVEEEITRALLPKTVKDEHRALVQKEVEMVLGDARGQDLVQKALAALGRDERHDGEILSSFGLSMLRGRGLSEKEHATIKAAAVEKYLKSQGGTERQVAARKALPLWRAANPDGALAAFRAAGLFTLTRDDK